jgi:cellulose synthase/poly-beta-1,6-N-acetylglucosamine synthase-like glycosyltransferase
MSHFTIYDWLFLISMAATWMLLLYHVFLTFGGYRYFLRSIDFATQDYQEIVNYPQVSVLVPAHNEEMVIGRTVDSLLRLDYPADKIEIIVINDSSTDRTGEILAEKQAKNKQLKVVTIHPPLGAKGKSNALNQGLKEASGNLLRFTMQIIPPSAKRFGFWLRPSFRIICLAQSWGSFVPAIGM